MLVAGRLEAQEGTKKPLPSKEKGLAPRADYDNRISEAVNRNSPLAQASAPRAVRSLCAGSATLDRPLIRECLFYPTDEPLSMLLGSGLYAAREPRLPRIRLKPDCKHCPLHAKKQTTELHCQLTTHAKNLSRKKPRRESKKGGVERTTPERQAFNSDSCLLNPALSPSGASPT
jgi:hypothetical protein